MRPTRFRSIVWGLAAASMAVGGCGLSGGHSAATTTTPTVAATTTTSTTTHGIQTSGSRTVLSPTGLNVRDEPDKSAKAIGSAGQGTVLTVLGHISTGGGWYKVRGETVTGWMSADPAYSAPGEFRAYSGATFSALYPPTWTYAGAGPSSVVFRPISGPGTIVATVAANVTKLGQGRVGYGQTASKTIVVCGFTSDLVTYNEQSTSPATTTPAKGSTAPKVAPEPYLVQVQLTLDAHHAVGFSGNLTDLGPQLQIFTNLIDSVSVNFPQCIG